MMKEKVRMNRIVDEQITLIPYYRNDAISLLWYQDSEVCKQVDNTDQIYDVTKLHKMYDYLTSHGSCYYIQYEGVLVGDVTLQDNSELSIVISKEYQNLHIGRRCVSEMIHLAKEQNKVRSLHKYILLILKVKECFWLWDFRK